MGGLISFFLLFFFLSSSFFEGNMLEDMVNE